jgi:hypothetical protein
MLFVFHLLLDSPFVAVDFLVIFNTLMTKCR